MNKNSADLVRTISAWLLIFSVGLGITLLLLRPLIVDSFTLAAFNGEVPGILAVPHSEQNLQAYQTAAEYGVLANGGVVAIGAVLALVACGSLVAIIGPEQLLQFPWRGLTLRLARPCLWLIAAFTATFLVNQLGHWGSWYPLEDALSFDTYPPYRHRVLMPLVANGFGVIIPFAENHTLYLTSQFLVLLALFPLTARFVGLFCDRGTATLASLMLIVLIVAMQQYFTFYDLGIALFYTLGLYLLATKQNAIYLAVIPIATLNHEIILFLILLSGVLSQPFNSKFPYDWKFVLVQVAAYSAVRAALFFIMPTDRASALGNIWINLHFIVNAVSNRGDLIGSYLTALWFGLALLGLPHAPSFLRRAASLLVLLIGSTLLVGQVNESRQFAAFVPVAIALTACLFRAGTRPEAV